MGLRRQTKMTIAGIVVLVAALGALSFLWKGRATAPVPAPVTQAVSAPALSADVNSMVARVSQNLSRPKKDQSEEQVQQQAKQLPAADLESLKKRALSMSENGNDRSAAMYLLTQAGTAARSQLTDVAATPLPHLEKLEDPHSAGALQRTFEISLRIRALEALDKMGVQDPSLAQNFDQIARTQTDPTLKFLVQVCQQGLQQGRPGKLTRFIDKAIDERGQPPADH